MLRAIAQHTYIDYAKTDLEYSARPRVPPANAVQYHTAAGSNAYLRVESSTVFASRFAEAREVIAYAANSTASQITPAMSAMR